MIVTVTELFSQQETRVWRRGFWLCQSVVVGLNDNFRICLIVFINIKLN